jgi:hypothetical protein
MRRSGDLGKPPHRRAHHGSLELLEVLHLLVGNRDVDGDSGRLAFVEGLESPVVDEVVHEAGDHDCRSRAPHFQAVGQLQLGEVDVLECELCPTHGPGEITSLPSGHDAWVVGDEPVVVIDWYGASNYAKHS